MPRLNNRQCVSAIANREGFSNSTGSFHGEWSHHPSLGYLPDASRQILWDVTHNPVDKSWIRVYVVYSYDTPIAYAEPGARLTVFDHKYSNTTGRHTSYCRQAASRG
jgi:hypothetical protein